MNKKEYLKLVSEVNAKHLKFKSGLELEVTLPSPAVYYDALAKFDDLDKRIKNPDLEIFLALAKLIKDKDGDSPATYLIGEEYVEFVSYAKDFFQDLPTIQKSQKESQPSSEKDSKTSDTGPTNSSI
jgi:hypothetical protein